MINTDEIFDAVTEKLSKMSESERKEYLSRMGFSIDPAPDRSYVFVDHTGGIGFAHSGRIRRYDTTGYEPLIRAVEDCFAEQGKQRRRKVYKLKSGKKVLNQKQKNKKQRYREI